MARAHPLLSRLCPPSGASRNGPPLASEPSTTSGTERKSIGGDIGSSFSVAPKRSVGTVLWFDPQRAYGFIVQAHDGAHVFVHQHAVERSGLIGLFAGQVVEFELVPRVGHHVMAANLRLLAAFA